MNTNLAPSNQRSLPPDVLRAIDPAASDSAFEAALQRFTDNPQGFVEAVFSLPRPEFERIEPARLLRIARMAPRRPGSAELRASCIEAIRAARANDDNDHREIDRAYAVASLLQRIGGFEMLDGAEIEWLFRWHPRAAVYLVEGLDAWVRARPLSRSTARLVRDLRDEEPDSPMLDRLAARVVPSVEGIYDLAGWENGVRCCGDADWCAARARWSAGQVDAEADAAALEPSLDPESSSNAEVLADAIQLHGWPVLEQVLRDALAQSDDAVQRRLVGAWLERFGRPA